MVRIVELEGQVGDGGREVGVAGPLAVAVDAPLHLGRPGLHRHQRVGHGAAGVVVAVDAELRARCGRARRPPPGPTSSGSDAAVGVAQHERLGPGLLGGRAGPTARTRGCAGSRRRSARRRGRPAGRARAGSAPSRPPWPPPRRGRCAAPRRRGGPTTWPRCRRPGPRRRPGWRRTASSSGLTPARRVEPNATSVAVPSVSSFLARAKNSTSLGLAPGQPPSMKVTPRWSSCSATRSLSSTVSERPSCWLPSRRMVSKMSTASGSSGRAKSWAWALWPCAWVWRTPPWLCASARSVDMVQPVLVLVDLAAHGGEVGLLDLLGDPARACPAPTGRSSTARIGTTSAAVPVRKASSAR